MQKSVTFLSLNKQVTKEVSLRGANVALPRARYALLRISRGAITEIPNNVLPGRAVAKARYGRGT